MVVVVFLWFFLVVFYGFWQLKQWFLNMVSFMIFFKVFLKWQLEISFLVFLKVFFIFLRVCLLRLFSFFFFWDDVVKVFVNEGYGFVNEVIEVVYKFFVDFFFEVFKGEVVVFCFGYYGGEVVFQVVSGLDVEEFVNLYCLVFVC